MATKQEKQRRFSIGYLVSTLILLMLLQIFLMPLTEPQRVPYSQFLKALDENNVAEAQISESEILWKTRDKGDLLISARLPGIDDSQIISQLRQSDAVFAGNILSKFWTNLLSWVVPIGLFIFLWYFLIGRVGGNQQYLSFGRSRARVYNRGLVNITFDNAAGVDEAKAELQEVVDFLKNPQKYRALGGKIPKGILLVGPPGTGKTLLAKATAGEAGVPFFSMSGSEFVEMFVGVGAARVRDLFEQARKNAPCIVFIDEIDTIGKQRGGVAAIRHEEQEQTLNQLLTEMDGFDSSQGVIIMAATNRPDVLDPALLRPGRFDRQIVVDKPDMKGREEILKVHARNVKLAPDVDLHTVAARTPGFAGAELANVINEAALLAARRGKQAVEMSELEDKIAVLLGGRVAEEIVIGQISTGAQNDLYQATQLAVRMVREFGMSEKLGPLAFGDGNGVYPAVYEPGLLGKQYSEETARAIDSDVRAIIERNYQRVKAVLTENVDILKEFSRELEQKETIQGSELREKLVERMKTQADKKLAG